MQWYTLVMNNYRFTITYDGTRYLGWERQPGKPMTIQGKLEQVLSRMLEAEGQSPAEMIGCGRTDAGVHARAMVANARFKTRLTTDEIRDYMNRYLPEDICIREVEQASDRFHARYNAIGKTYRYTCYVGSRKPVFDRKYVWHIEQQPALDSMRRAAALLTGTHDYAGFCANPRMKKSTVRTVDLIDISQNGAYLTLTFHGTGFLQYMVRILTGTLLEVGFGQRTPESMTQLLEEKDRRLAGQTAPACGLCMMKVDYH